MKRRSVLKAIGAIGGAFTLGPQVVSAEPVDDRWMCNVEDDRMALATIHSNDNVDVKVDLSDEIGYCVVECAEADLPVASDIDFERFHEEYNSETLDKAALDTLREKAANDEPLPYAPDIKLELVDPQVERDSGLNAADTVDDDLSDLQWDKQSQRIGQVHETATGAGGRVGIIDTGVLGADPDRDVSHPDLPNVREDLSMTFTSDGQGPGPVGIDHGTHVAGIAAAVANGTGVVGVAPDAEVVDLRVFGATGGASTSSIANAIVYGATPEEQGGAGCDAVNLSLSTGTLPVCSFIGLLILLFYYPVYEAAGQFALDNDCLPVASAGNAATDLADPVAGGFCAPPSDVELFGETGFFTLPASVEEFMTVGATGPLGFGWGDGHGRGPRGTEEVGDTGIEIEHPIQTELFTEEPAFYSNYGGNGEVNVTASGGNADLDAETAGENYHFDLVFSTVFEVDSATGAFVPSYGWKAGTSMSAPQVTGLVALLAGEAPDASASEIRSVITGTARQHPVGKGGQTTAPETFPNILGQTEGTGVQSDSLVNGDQPSNPGSNPQTHDSEYIRGSGHIDIGGAVAELGD